MSSKKKFSKLAVLSVLGLLALTACDDDEIVAKPSNYEDPIIEIAGSEEEIPNNVFSVIYDALHDGAVDAEVLSRVLYEFSQSIYGSYNSITASNSKETTLEKAYKNAMDDSTDKTVVNDFIKKHKVYWLRDEEGRHINDKGDEVDDETFTPCESERQNVIARWQTIATRVAENMYKKCNTGTYKERDYYFDELKFLKSLFESGEKVDYHAAKAAREKGKLPKVIIDYLYEEESVFEKQDDGITVLHLAYYQNHAKGKDITYIEDKIIPDVYNALLVEQYLLDEELASVRNSRARYINVLKLEKYSGFMNNADALIDSLVEDIYAIAPTGDHVSIQQDKIDDLFEAYETVSKGIWDDIQNNPKSLSVVTDLQKIASDIYEEDSKVIDGVPTKFYKNTTYGDLVKDYAEFKEASTYDDLDKSLYDEFTASGTILPSEGFAKKIIGIEQTNTITKDWFVQSQAPSLDSNGKIADRLFKLSVANDKVEIGKKEDGVKSEVIAKAIEDQDVYDRYYKDGNDWKIRESGETEDKYMCSINGAYFLKFEGQYADADSKKDIVYDDGNAYYVVQVIEAVKDVKLRNTSENSYRKTRGDEFFHEVLDKITSIIAATGNYSSLSKEHWLKQMNITYHDQKVYDYFKENYPDLFDDED